MSRQHHNIAFIILLLSIAAIATWLLFFSTPQGLGLSDDSIAYIAGARSLMQGTGYRELWLASSQPVTHFPPGLSSVLATIGLLIGMDPLRGVRLLNGLLFGGNVILMGMLGSHTLASKPGGIFIALIFASNASLLRLHTDAMSEPLFIFLTLVAFLVFARYSLELFATPENQTHPRNSISLFNKPNFWLVLTGCMTGLAYLTRYAGLALAVAFILLLLLIHKDWSTRFISAGLFLGSFLPWLLAWSVRNRLLGGTSTNRALQFHPISVENLEITKYNISEFLIPIESWRRTLFNLPGFFEALIFLVGMGGLILLIRACIKMVRKTPDNQTDIISLLFGLYAISYLGSVIFAMTFFDASTKFRLRILAPSYVCFLFLLVSGALWLLRIQTKQNLRAIHPISNKRAGVKSKKEKKNKTNPWSWILVSAGLVWIGLSIFDSSQVVAALRKGGEGYASFQWYDSKAMEFLRNVSPDLKIYTNEPGAVYLYTNRGGYVLPTRFDPVTAQERPGFQEGVAIVQRDVRSGTAVLAVFDGGETQPEDVASLTEGLYLSHKSSGDAIYSATP